MDLIHEFKSLTLYEEKCTYPEAWESEVSSIKNRASVKIKIFAPPPYTHISI